MVFPGTACVPDCVDDDDRSALGGCWVAPEPVRLDWERTARLNLHRLVGSFYRLGRSLVTSIVVVVGIGVVAG